MARKNTESKTSAKSASALDELNAIFKQHKLSELKNTTEEDFEVERIPTGYPELDEITNGGYPVGAVSVIWGPEKSGKSSLAIKAMAEVQAMGGTGFYYDLENGISKQFATSLGMNLVNGTAVVRPPTEFDNAETVMDVIVDVIKKTNVKLIVLDSVSSLVPKNVYEGSAEDNSVGLIARILSQNLGKICGLVKDYNKALIIISQEREIIGAKTAVGQRTPTAMTGGKSLKFYNSLTLYARPKFTSKTDRPDFYEGERQIGHVLKVTVQKSRVSLPNGVAEVDFYYKPIRRILGLLKSNYGEESIIKRAKNNHAKFEYTNLEGNTFKGMMQNKTDWESLFIWFKESDMLFDFLQQIGEYTVAFLEVLLEDGDITEEEYNEHLIIAGADTPELVEESKKRTDLVKNKKKSSSKEIKKSEETEEFNDSEDLADQEFEE